MSTNFKLEVFESNKTIKPIGFHTYSLKSFKLEENPFKVIRGACKKLANYNINNGVYENGKKIFSLEQIENIPENADFSLEYEGITVLEIHENKKVYEEYIKTLIRNRLSTILVNGKYKKYSTKYNISSGWFKDIKGNWNLIKSDDGSIQLERGYKIRVNIGDDNKIYLWINTVSEFRCKDTIMDLLNKGKNVIGYQIKNDWAYFSQTGVVVDVWDKTVVDNLSFGSSLKDYYIKKGEGVKVMDLPDETPVVQVKPNNGNNDISYYPQALRPIITREKLSEIDSNFSMRIEDLVKRDMKERIELDKAFIQDIGCLEELDNLSFEENCCEPYRLGYRKAIVDLPKLLCGDGKTISCGEEQKIFYHGFYQPTKKTLKLGFVYPMGERDLLIQVVNEIYLFAVKGCYHGKKDNWIKEGLINIQKGTDISKDYKLGSITDYKRAARELIKQEEVDIVIALVPDQMDDENPYNPFKSVWAEHNIPSQMITMKTAKKFVMDAKNGKNGSKWYLHNIVLGILGKTGGIPWVVDKMPGNVDCFVGLDVAKVEKGIHFPACSVMFDKYGRLMGFFKPRTPQQGEKITTEILQDIFDQVLFSYEDTYGSKPKNIVIHRDGFNNEDEKWYENYFAAQGIEYSIIEVRKNISSKMLDEEVPNMNPTTGMCIYNDKTAYLVTTVMKKKKGSPNPLLLEKSHGSISMPEAIQQVLYLTQLHVGSTQKMRLPITTGYADKICKNLDYVPAGQVDNKLFFL
ncbi:MAG: hypothetical protein K6D38_06540 [Pseudobutyrivibrio sp.]|nr:hypothetical protein [Pseudobutyrivibrio sp.]